MGKLSQPGSNKNLKAKIDISVIVPAHNEENYIGNCLKALKNQDFKNYEIIVVNNGSTDKTADVVKKLGIRVVSQPQPSITKTREKGRLLAKANLLVFIDADTIIPKNYLSKVYKIFENDKEVAAMSSPYIFYDGNIKTTLLIKFLVAVWPFYFKITRFLRIGSLLFGSNFAARKSILDKIGGFNTNIKFYGEDVDTSKRLSRVGKTLFVSNLFVKVSARRYVKLGILKTCFFYTVNYFTIFFANKTFESKKIEELNFRSSIFYKFALVSIVVVSFGYAMAYPTSNIFGKSLYKLNYSDKVVALTFDDGPNGQYTEKILDILDKNNIKATFFLIGKNVEYYPEVARDIVKRGNEVGNHSYTHSWRIPFETKNGLTDEVTKAEDAIFKETGVKTNLFRPPHYWRTPWMVEILHQEGYKIITSDDYMDDYSKKEDTQKIAKRIIKNVKPGAIIVLHDGLNLIHNYDSQRTVEALGVIIKTLKSQGYQFVTIPEKENNIKLTKNI